jgi:hypothetical protein
MVPQFLLPETVVTEDGVGPEIALESREKAMLLTLGITRIIEQETLDISLWGSTDCERWYQVDAFPQKFYCGTYSMVVDLNRFPKTRYLRIQWKMSRWSKTQAKPLFAFYLFVEDVKLQHAGAA